MSSDVNPDPVPPPKEWKMRNPCKKRIPKVSILNFNPTHLKSSAVFGQATDPVQCQIDDLLSDGVVAAGVVVGCVFFARDQLLGMEQMLVRPGPDFV